MMNASHISRRTFLGTSAAAGVFSIVPRHVLGGTSHTAPSDRLTHAVIGCGIMGGIHIRSILGDKTAQLISLCDVDRKHLQQKAEMASKQKVTVNTYHDFRELLAKEDIDVVRIVTPTHWHAVMAIAAAEAGCDIWCEKPLTRTIGESEALRKAVQAHGRMLRINTWFRFAGKFYGMGVPVAPIKKLVDSGGLGWPLTVRLSKYTGFGFKLGLWTGKPDNKPQPIPKWLDWDLWQGPAHEMPYHPHRTHFTFRGYWPYDAGGLGDMGQHYLDPVQYLLGKDNESPVEVESMGPWPQHPDCFGGWGAVTMTYADGCKIIMEGDTSPHNLTKDKPFIEGPKGKIYKDLRTEPAELSQLIHRLPDPLSGITDFNKSVRTRKPFALNEQNGHRSNILVHLADIAIRLPRKLQFDGDALRFIDDPTANRLAYQPMRAPWKL